VTSEQHTALMKKENLNLNVFIYEENLIFFFVSEFHEEGLPRTQHSFIQDNIIHVQLTVRLMDLIAELSC
jgi:hypothetical protein